MRARTLVLVAALVAAASFALAPPASAGCAVNVKGSCTGNCLVNAGFCRESGECKINLATCGEENAPTP